ncbi:hypothetical protein CR513_20005, partial [Mucuna pruriens]
RPQHSALFPISCLLRSERKWWDTLLVPEDVLRIHFVALEITITPRSCRCVVCAVLGVYSQIKIPVIHICLSWEARHIKTHVVVKLPNPIYHSCLPLAIKSGNGVSDSEIWLIFPPYGFQIIKGVSSTSNLCHNPSSPVSGIGSLTKSDLALKKFLNVGFPLSRTSGGVPLGKPATYSTELIQLVSKQSFSVKPNSGKLVFMT